MKRLTNITGIILFIVIAFCSCKENGKEKSSNLIAFECNNCVVDTTYTITDSKGQKITVTTLPMGMKTITTYSGASVSPIDTGIYKPPKYRDYEIVDSRKIPAIKWSAPEDMTYLDLISDKQLNATSTVKGKFSYNHSIGERLDAGDYELTVTFIPDDKNRYLSIKKSVPLHINKY